MKRFAIVLVLCTLLLCALTLTTLAEDTAFELGHMEGTTYVNADMGIAFEASGFSGMEKSLAGDALDEVNGCAWNDALALLEKLEAGDYLTCYAFGDASMHIAGAVNLIRITVQNAAEGAEHPELALLEEGKDELEKQAKENGYNMEKAVIGEIDFIDAVRPCLSMDFESGGRHKQQLYVTVLANERIYRICFDMDTSEVTNYVGHFSVR